MSKLPIPAQALAQHTAILGKTGSGKTSTEKLIVEHVVADDFRVCVLDTTKSDWWGITSSADGKHAGLPFKILGGPRGHVPLHSSAGKVIGQLVGSGKLPLSIIDMADFEAGGIQRFFIEFAPALMRSARGVLYLVIEEAHELAPKERSGIGNENMAIHWAKKLATAGRSKGIRLIVATQRIQALHNAVLGSCDTMIAHRLTAPADQEPVKKWLKANTDKETQEKVANSLASMPTGTAWVCSGEARIFKQVEFPKFKTYDNTATPTGDSIEVAVKTAPVDQDELRAIIGDAVKEAEANDPKLLKAQISKLTAELAKRPATAAQVSERVVIQSDPAEIRKAHRAGFDAGFERGAVISFQIAIENLTQIARDVSRVETKLELFRDKPKRHDGYPDYEIKPSGPAGASPAPAAPMRAVTAPSAQRAKSSPAPGGDDTLTGPMRRILDSLAFWEAVGNGEPKRSQVAFVAGYSPKSSGFEKALSVAKTSGLIVYPNNGLVALADEGRARAVEPSGEDAKRAINSVLTNPQKIVADALIAARGPISRDRLAAATNYSDKSSGYEKVLSQLNTLGIAFYPSSGHVEIAEWAAELLS